MKTDKADKSLKEENPGRCIDCPTLPDGTLAMRGGQLRNIEEGEGRAARSPGLALKIGEDPGSER